MEVIVASLWFNHQISSDGAGRWELTPEGEGPRRRSRGQPHEGSGAREGVRLIVWRNGNLEGRTLKADPG
jgi:hypothetical protein